MNPKTTRRALLGAGIAFGSAAIIAKQGPKRAGDARFGEGSFAGFSREPLRMAMLESHAQRLEPVIPDLEQLIRRYISIEALTFKQLYDNFTIDLLQQTGRYDVVSICDAWIPYFGRAGYFSEVPMPDDAGGRRVYPPVIAQAAIGIDNTPQVAHPWTFDFACSAFGPTLTNPAAAESWIAFSREIANQPTMRLAIPALPAMDSSETFRSLALSFGQDVIEAETNEPGLDKYGSQRAMVVLNTLARQAGVDASLATTWQRIGEAARNGEIDHAPLIAASDLSPLLRAGQWSVQLLPVGRAGRFRTAGQIWMLAVPAGAPSLDDARTAIQWFTSTPVQIQLWPATGLLPATRPAINAVPPSGETRMRSLMFAALDNLQPIPRLRSFQSVMGIAGDTVPLVLHDPAKTNQYLNQANDAAIQHMIDEGELATN